jgi:hypothetical protein
LAKGKWYAALAMDTQSGRDWGRAFRSLRAARDAGRRLEGLLRAGDTRSLGGGQAVLSSDGTEITFADGVPLVPEINPIVVLEGSDYEMGYQYARQVIEIFGPWLMERKAGRAFSKEERDCMRQWEAQLEQHAPEIPEMCRGWAAGATAAGVPMSYDDVLEIWTGREPPAEEYMGIQPGRLRALPRPACSGIAAWGRATVDGGLVTASSGDHDATYAATIVAFPQTGNAFVYTPFSVIGDVPEVGPVYMMGHPGMNDKGLAYVEHGGEVRMVEPKATWGYGVRKGPSVLHVLRFAGSAREALEMELAFPVGDVGRVMGSAGGFYADSTYGYVLESRRDPVIIREAGVMGETDFLVASNNAMHPGAERAGWMQWDPEGWAWDEHGGWYPTCFTPFSLAGAFRMTPEERILMGLRTMYSNSRGRNLYAFDALNRAAGRIDLETVKMLYRQSGSFPPGTLEQIRARYSKTGEWGEYSLGHATNALVAVMKPEDGLYALCVGTAERGLTPNTPTRAMPIYGETNAFWEIRLGNGPAEVAGAAGRQARACIERAEIGFESSVPGRPGDLLGGLLGRARKELDDGLAHEASAAGASGDEAVYGWARATRAYTRAQVRALQVSRALAPGQPTRRG